MMDNFVNLLFKTDALAAFAIFLCIVLILLVINLTRTKSELKLQESRLRTIFESEPDCVKLQTIDGGVIDMNTAGLDILEVDDISEVNGHTVYEFINSEHHKSYEKLTKSVFQGNSEMMEFKIHSKNGRERWLETNAVPLRDHQNNISSLLAITRDVTERKELERNLKQRQMDLERVCRVSTMGEVATGIAHELNQPLCAISSYSETCISLLESGDIVDLKENLQLIFEQSQKASGIVSWIRELASNKKNDLQRLCLNELLKEYCSYLEFYLEKNNTKIILNDLISEYYVYADRVQLEHVLVNLIKNSVDSMSCNAFNRIINISVESENENVIVSVIDKGIGIKEDNINKVTNPYFTTREDGLGMGLPISRSIIKAHNGELWVKSTSKHGTTICFSLCNAVERNTQFDEKYA